MNRTLQDQLTTEIDRGGRAYIRNLALAEAAVLRGQFNLAKVLRALAHTQRIQAMSAARVLAQDIDPRQALGTIIGEIVDGDPVSGAANAAVREQAQDVARRAQASLAQHSDVAETAVAQSLWGCYGCGYLAEGEQPDACPTCGALAPEFEWFGPFYSHTPEHLGQLNPAEILTILEGGPDVMAAVIAGIDEAQLHSKPSPREWSIAEIAGHVLETERLFTRRVHALLSHQGLPNLDTPVPPWKLQEGRGYETISGAELLGRLRQAREDSVALVRGLAPEEWARAGTIRGTTTTLLDLGTWLANHDRGHLAQMRQLASLPEIRSGESG
jgi:rubrerythrin